MVTSTATQPSVARTALEERSSKGDFVRKESSFRNIISKENLEFPPEAGRYHLYVSHACPWANRTTSVRSLKGLESVIGISVVHPTWQRTRPDDPNDSHLGWVFTDDEGGFLVPPSGHGQVSNVGTVPDAVNGAKSVRDLYEMSNDTSGKYSVPVLWDKKTKQIVNNESSEILRMMNGPFAELVGTDRTTPDLYPKELQKAIDDANAWIYPGINNGVYKNGFATSQEAYEKASEELSASLSRLEKILATQRYVASPSQITEADVRLFMTLARFDEVYVVYFKCNTQPLRDFPNIRNYCRELYQMPWLGESIHMDHIKNHYYTSHPTLNHYSIVPKGPNVLADFSEPHDRDRLPLPQNVAA